MNDDPQKTPQADGKLVDKLTLPEVGMARRKPHRNWPDANVLVEHEASLKENEFRKLPADVPLLLMPVRLETRLDLRPGNKRLLVRFMPEQLHVTKDDRQLTEREAKAGAQFWTYASDKSPDTLRAALDRLATAVGPRRLGHVIDATNPNVKGEEDNKHREPFAPPPRPHLTMIPYRWFVVGYTPNGLGFFRDVAPVKHPLEVSATGLPDSMTQTYKGVPVSKANRWMYDFGEAERRGMAIDIPLLPQVLAEGRLSTLIAFGVAGSGKDTLDGDGARKVLEDLLSGHERTTGIGFLAQGSVTNNVKGEATPWGYSDADLDRLAETLLLQDKDRALPEHGNLPEFARALGLSDIRPLARAAGATDPERQLSRAVNTVLFDALIGTFLRSLLDPGSEFKDPESYAEFRTWFITYVTGGAPLPTLRIGPQPYGVLPVMPLPRSVFSLPKPKTLSDHILNTVVHLRDTWEQSLDLVPLLDPNATDAANVANRPPSAIPDVLASQPHPTRLFRRQVVADKDGIVAQYKNALSDLPRDNARLWDIFSDRTRQFENAEDIDEQIAVWGRIQLDIINESGVTQSWKNKARKTVDAILAILGQFEQRQRPLKMLEIPGFEGALGRKLSPYLRARPDPEREEIDLPLVAQDDTDAGNFLKDRLIDMAQYVEKPDDKAFLERIAETDLFGQLVINTASDLPKSERKEVVEALELLAQHCDPKMLDRMVREALGLVTHRLDAWYTSVAAEKVETLRKTATTPKLGLSFGAYGWITDLELTDKKPASNGFIHAPSLAHASTASVLRAGWLAHGGGERVSPAAVDLGSRRIRLAQSLLEGVRLGQPLGTLLGYRFERSMRDDPKGLSGFIRDIRLAILDASDSDATEDEPVDGLLLLEHWKAGDLDQLTALRNKNVGAHLDAIEDAFDALYDLALFEGTHAALNGMTEHATAVFEAINQGSQLPPEFRAQKTGTNGIDVEHRLMVLLPADGSLPNTGTGWASGFRDRLAPEIELWVQSLLPPADKIGLSVEGSILTCQDLALSALDALYLMSDDPTLLSPDFLAVVAAYLNIEPRKAASLVIDLSPKGTAYGLEEVQLLATELRELIVAGVDTPLTPDDLDGRGAPDAAAPLARPKVADQLPGLMIDLVEAADAADLGTLARFGLVGAALDVLQDRAQRVVTKAEAMLPSASTAEVAAALFGRSVPISQPFLMPGSADGKASVPFIEDFSKEARAWLDKVGAVRPPADRLSALGFLSTHLDCSPQTLSVAQDKRQPGEGWAALSRPPEDSGGRLSIVAVGPVAAPPVGKSAVGFSVDRWSERIPARTEVTGLSFHYDAPSTRPPQSLLLTALPFDRTDWQLRDVAQTLLDTLQFSALRMVAPEDLIDFGAVLPTIYGQQLRIHPAKTEKDKT